MVDNKDFKWKTNTNKIIKIFMSLREGTSLAQSCVFWNLLKCNMLHHRCRHSLSTIHTYSFHSLKHRIK